MKFCYDIPKKLKLKYPVILAHGIACRDHTEEERKTAWGRIPESLREKGVDVYFGDSDGWASIEDNALKLKRTVNKILKKTGKNKVNIIAHSKGGLDARYMISELDMEDKVASLTTINTPHEGVKLVDFMIKYIPKPIYRFISNMIDKIATKKGDENSNCMQCSFDLSHSYCEEFNKKIKDSKKVYYQSFSTFREKKNPGKYFIPRFVLHFIDKDKNDGIVSYRSAHWKNFIFWPQFKNFDHDNLVDHGSFARKNQGVLLLYANLIMILITKSL